MPPQAYPYAVLTDGTTTVTFADGAGGATNWPMARGQWAPAIAPRRRRLLGGSGPYEPVMESFVIHVRGTTAAAAMTNLGTLARLLDQAERFERGESVAPVLFKYAPQGSEIASSSNPYTARVLGSGPDARTASQVILPAEFAEAGMLYEIRDVSVSFWRVGTWTLDSVAPTVTAGGSTPTVFTSTWAASVATPSPLRVRIGGFAHDNEALTDSVLLVAEASSDFGVVEGETGSGGGTGGAFTTSADSTNKASGGSVGRWTPSAAGAFNNATWLLSNSIARERCDLWAVVRSSVARPWAMYAETRDPEGRTNGRTVARETRAVTTPQIVYLGSIYSASARHKAFSIYFNIASLSGSPAIDIDYIVGFGMEGDTNRALSIWSDSLVKNIDYIEVAPQHLTDTAPRVAAEDTAVLDTTYILGRQGDAYLNSSGTTLAALWMATKGAHWRWTNAAGTVPTLTITPARWPAYVVPQ